MPNTLHARIGPRDLELLTAIDRFPVTSAQLCRISLSFKEPFRDENNLRRRLRSRRRLVSFAAFRMPWLRMVGRLAISS